MSLLHRLLPLLCALALGCGDDGSPESDPFSDGGTPWDAGSTDASTEVEPLYAFVTQVIMPSGQTSYVVLGASVDDAMRLSLDDALEVPGRAIGAAPSMRGSIYVGNSEGATITRYDLDASGELVEVDEVSFAGQGVTAIGEYQDQFQFVSETKAYYFDGLSAQMVVWNPSAMTVTGSIDLSELYVEDAVLSTSTHTLRDGDTFFFPLGWRAYDLSGIPSRAAVLILDGTNDGYRVLSDDRCGYVRSAVRGPDGRIYLATEAYGSAVHRVAPDTAPPPCLLRLNEANDGFDQDFHVELGSLVGGAVAGSLLPGADGRAWLRVLDETMTTVTPDANPRVLASTEAWAWWEVELDDDPEASRREDLRAGSGSDFFLDLASDERYLPLFADDRSETTFRDFSAGVPGEEGATIPGLVFSALRIR